MIERLALVLAAMAVAVAVVCATWPDHTHASTPERTVATDSVFAQILPSDNPLVPLLDAAYRDLERAMQPHGCVGCHAPDLETGGHRERVRHAVTLLDTRRSLESIVDANAMPPETDDHAAGIADKVERARLLHRVRVFRALGDAALASW